MKTRTIILIMLILGVTALLTSCKKYDEPLLSLKSKTERVANTWTFNQVIAANLDITSDYSGMWIALSKDGVTQYSDGTIGTWEFINNKDNIKIISSYSYESEDGNGDLVTYTYTENINFRIEVLKEKEMNLSGTLVWGSDDPDDSDGGSYSVSWKLTGN